MSSEEGVGGWGGLVATQFLVICSILESGLRKVNFSLVLFFSPTKNGYLW